MPGAVQLALFHIWFMRSGDVVRCRSANHLPDAIKRINLMLLNPAALRLKGPTQALRYGLDSYGWQQCGIFRND